MTDVSGVAANTNSPALQNSQASLADNFEMFLTLLTEQMKNQDPLDPLDSTQFVNQLVDFSSVEQQIAQNQNLENLLLLQSAAAQSASVGYIGREATALTPDTTLSNGQASWQYVLPRDAETTGLVIRDDNDRIVARLPGETSTGTHSVNWDGKDTNGTTLADGIYTLEVLSVDSDDTNIDAQIQAAAAVTGIDLSGNEVVVEMGGIRVPLSSIVSLRQAETANPGQTPAS